jgi:membrane-associated phospholipid phosphatase
VALFVATVVPMAAMRGQETPRDTAPASEPPPPAFSRVEARRFLGVVALGAVAYTLDEAARERFIGTGDRPGDLRYEVAAAGNKFGSPGAVTLGVLMWGGGLIARRPTLAASGLRAIEAITVSGFVTTVLKETAGRARPNVAVSGRTDWQLLRGARTSGGDYEAMASGHATAAFAFATAVTGEVALRAPERARAVGVVTFGLAGLTAYARMHDDRHWLSDVTVGAGIGTVTALAIRRWHTTRPENVIDRWLLRPTVTRSPFGGLRVGLELTPR